MATHTPNSVNWWLEIDLEMADYLLPVRHWDHLSMAASAEVVWVRGLRPGDPDRKEIKSIPFKRLLYEREGQLYPAGGLVPLKRSDGELNWMPLEKGLPLRLPSFNHNYFGIQERVMIELVPSSNEQPAAASLTAMEHLRPFAETAPSIRLRLLKWVVLDGQALILGNALVPLPGDLFWLRGDHLLPVGMDLQFPILAEVIRSKFERDGDFLFLWDRQGRGMPVDKRSFRPLSRSSIRQT